MKEPKQERKTIFLRRDLNVGGTLAAALIRFKNLEVRSSNPDQNLQYLKPDISHLIELDC